MTYNNDLNREEIAASTVSESLRSQIQKACDQAEDQVGEMVEEFSQIVDAFNTLQKRVDEWVEHVDEQAANTRRRLEDALQLGTDFKQKTNLHALESQGLLKKAHRSAKDVVSGGQVVNTLAIELYHQAVSKEPDMKLLRELSIKLILQALSAQLFAHDIDSSLTVVDKNLESCFEQFNTSYNVHQKSLKDHVALSANVAETLERHVVPEFMNINSQLNSNYDSVQYRDRLSKIVDLLVQAVR